VSEPGRQEIEADGLLVTPGWVDIHTHYDGQVTWDPEVSPSGWHGRNHGGGVRTGRLIRGPKAAPAA
jgi:imidazolonepropionase-like amidohydrolase